MRERGPGRSPKSASLSWSSVARTSSSAFLVQGELTDHGVDERDVGGYGGTNHARSLPPPPLPPSTRCAPLPAAPPIQ